MMRNGYQGRDCRDTLTAFTTEELYYGGTMSGSSMGSPRRIMIRRRDVLLAVTSSVAIAAAGAIALAPATSSAETETVAEKRKARYQANSPEVQDFYRVNRYPRP